MSEIRETQTRRQPGFGRLKAVHMVGIGGIGMSSIAEVLLARGYEVSGSDLKRSDVTERLEDLGATIYEGHAAEHVTDTDVLVFSSAVKPDRNPETIEAQRRRIPIIRRAEMLGELMRQKYGIGVAGTHGKTTTTSMVGLVVREGGFDPTIIVGGKVAVFDSNAVSGEGDIIIIEADEYDRTFLKLTPVLAVITNIEADHLDIYKDMEDIKEAFLQFANAVPFFGAAILCIDDVNVRSILGQVHRRVITYGMARQAKVRAADLEQEGPVTRFTVFHGEYRLGEVELNAPGHHNVQNALAAVAVGLELDISFDRIRQALARYTGVQRRFQIKGEIQGHNGGHHEGSVVVIDDYAHHPTEIAATLAAASHGWPGKRVIAVFQPHLYSRTRDLLDDFARSFYDADTLVITDVYGAREEPIEGISGATLAERATAFGHRDVHYVADKAELPKYLLRLRSDDDLVITMGAGDIWLYGQTFLDILKSDRSDELTSEESANG
jgi:UDP-N-acetylmuramate--alanine ligase